MPAAAVYTATDPCEYGSLIRGSDVEVLVDARGDFRAKVTRLDLDGLWIQRGEENLPRIFRSCPPKDRVIVSFIMEDSSPVIRLGGIQVSSRQITVMSPGQPSPWRSLGACKWGAMSMPAESFSRASLALGGEGVIPKEPRVVTPPPLLMKRLQALHRSAGHLAEAAPEIVAHPGAARGLEQALVEAMFGCIKEGTSKGTAGTVRHSEVMRRFEAVLGDNPDTALYMPDVCAIIGVPGRLLRACCAELLGMGPKQYLHLRRMHLARRALLRADPGSGTVTEIATRYGFWELGRFSVAYRSLFMELPSATLKFGRRSGDLRVGSSLPLPFAKFA